MVPYRQHYKLGIIIIIIIIVIVIIIVLASSLSVCEIVQSDFRLTAQSSPSRDPYFRRLSCQYCYNYSQHKFW